LRQNSAQPRVRLTHQRIMISEVDFVPGVDGVPNAGNANTSLQAGTGEPSVAVASSTPALKSESASGVNAPLSQSLARDTRNSQLPWGQPQVQPVSNIRAYLDTRKPVAHYTQEEPLFVTLPSAIRDDLRAMLGIRPGGGFCGYVESLVKAGLSVSQAIVESRKQHKVPGSLKRLRTRFDDWDKSGDWVALVNCAKAGGEWQDRKEGLPADFVAFCAKRFGQYKREDGKRQALLAIKRQWVTGRNSDGEREPIPGYGYKPANAVGYPPGWSYSNILRQVKARNALPESVRALLHQGSAAARSALPQVRGDRSLLRFLEVVEFDDVKTDFIVLDPESGQPCDLWLLVARDRATAILLGFGMRPARTREDGSQEHLRLRDMKQLCGWLLERYGLPPYESTWKVEHGTATLSEGTRAALRELLPGRINISYSSMIGGTSPAGYQQRGLGNSKGKASLESHNRLMHTMLADRPGQTGPIYSKRPMDLQARVKESAQIWQLTQHLPSHLRGQVDYSILTINQARENLRRIFQLQNERTEHELQGFEEVAEWYDESAGLWRHQSTFPGRDAFPGGQPQVRRRKESPLERCGRLITPYRDQWSRVSPEVIAAFYEHTVRQVVVKDSGLIEFRTDDRLVEFMPPDGQPQVPGTKLLAYFHPDDPAFLHLTDGRGRVLGTWLRRNRAHDHDTLQQAIRYSQAALIAAKQMASDYAAEDRERLEQMRARNAELLAADTFTALEAQSTIESQRPITSPIASAITATADQRAKTKKRVRDDDALAEKARAALARAANMF
jgi:hypothetical protein